MKFGHVFKETLRNEGFPPEWVDSAISYSQLKKCINRLTTELAQVGLDAQTLGKLLQQVEDYNRATEQDHIEERPFEYLLNDDEEEQEVNGAAGKDRHVRRKPFHPKLLFYVDEATGDLHSAGLDDATKKKLQMLAVKAGMTDLKVYQEPDIDASSLPTPPLSANTIGTRRRPGYRTVEVPLTSDSEFFSKLTNELSGLEALQAREEKRMHTSITALGQQISRLTNPDRRSNRKLLTTWRQIFQIYLESSIFFGTTERDHSGHTYTKATERFQIFSTKLASTGLVTHLKKPDSLTALNTFMTLNRQILQSLRFGEINRTAMSKILKKFDKQTSLGVKRTFPLQITYPDFTENLAKSVCAQVSTTILTTVPQIDDYSCPMCMEIKWRPVRLRCEHVFCIRCLIVMQTNKQHCCPLCREKTVIDACSENLDEEMAAFLKKWFPEEVRAKQKYNEVMAGVDQYGEVYREKCVVM